VKTAPLLLALGACAHTPLPAGDGLHYIEVHSTSIREVAHVAAAAAYLETLAGCPLWAGVEQVPDGSTWGDYSTKTEETHVWYVPKADLVEVSGKATTIGWFHGHKAMIESGRTDPATQTIALHELGHTLGLVHAPDSDTILDPYPLGSDWVLTAENQERLEGLCRSE
jgi:hypothetical protein